MSYRIANVSEEYLIAIAYVDRVEDLKMNKAKRDNAYKSFNSSNSNNNNNNNNGTEDSSSTPGCGMTCGAVSCMWNYAESSFIKYYVSKQRYNHCELGFPLEEDKSKCMAYGVFRECGVFSKERTFANSAYKWIYLKITGSQKQRLLDFCDNQIGKPFDYSGVKWSVIWPNKYSSKTYKDRKKWWCAPFIVAALQQIGMLTYQHPDCLDVDDIINLVKESEKIITSLSPYQFSLIFEEHSNSNNNNSDGSNGQQKQQLLQQKQQRQLQFHHCLSPQKLKQ